MVALTDSPSLDSPPAGNSRCNLPVTSVTLLYGLVLRTVRAGSTGSESDSYAPTGKCHSAGPMTVFNLRGSVKLSQDGSGTLATPDPSSLNLACQTKWSHNIRPLCEVQT